MIINRGKLAVIVLLALSAGVGLAVLILPFFDDHEPATTGTKSEPDGPHAAHDEGESYYTCPMHPSVISDEPGACPVCHMDLIKKSRSSEGMSPQELAKIGRVAMNPTQRVLANVQTTRAEAVGASSPSKSPAKSGLDNASETRAVGIVAYDESGLASVPSWLDGRIERLLVKETGTTIKRGQPIMRIYSPELLTAQQEFLIALENADLDDSLVAPTRQRLLLLGMSKGQIARVEESRKARPTITMTAPNAGTITKIMARQGQYVKEGTPLFELADLSTVWVDAKVYARDLAKISIGMDARITSDSLPGEQMRGNVTFIQPTLESDTRTAKVRVEIDNRDGRLKPGMYMSVFFSATDQSKAAKKETSDAPKEVDTDEAHKMTQKEMAKKEMPVRVPKSAVLRGGKSNSVYVEVIKNVFERRAVKIGRTTDRHLIITDGLKPGDKVAYQGAFLLDSEVELNSFGSGDTDAAADMNMDMDHAEQSDHAEHSKEGNDAANAPEESK